MAEIIDLGNGYGLLRGYTSRYASLTFPIGLATIRRLYCLGYLSDDETTQTLLDMGYSPAEVGWIVSLDKAIMERRKGELLNGRTA